MKSATLLVALTGSVCVAQPTITSLGTGIPNDLTTSISGTYYIGGSSGVARRWTVAGSTLTVENLAGSTGGGGQMSADGQFLTGHWLNDGTLFPRIFGRTATGVTPPFNPNPTLVTSTTQPAATEFSARRWSAAGNTWSPVAPLPINGSLLCYGSSSSGSSSGTFLAAHNMSGDGRYIVGQAYVCTYNNAGTAVSDNSFRWRPFIWDADTNTTTVLPTPLRTSSNTSLRRTGNAYAVSSDGTVILGAQEHNVSGTGGDSANHAVWRWNGSSYDMTLLNGGAISSTPSSLAMNSAGTIIVGRATDGSSTFLGRWTWNAGTNSWDGPENLGSQPATPATWLPSSVTSCAIPPILGEIVSMTDDGSTIVGSCRYSTCGSFMSGGFIYHNPGTGPVIEDWYDYNAARNVPGVAPNGVYGPIGELGDPTKGLPRLGFPSAIAPDGSATAGFQGGNLIIPGAQPWIIQNSGGPSCVAPTIVQQPSATINLSSCTSSLLMSSFSTGTAPFTYQWYKDGQPLSNGPTAGGSTVNGATEYLLNISQPYSPADVGTYHCVVTNACGSVTTNNAVVQIDPAFPVVPNDTCATAQAVTAGTNVLSPAQGLCGAFVNDPLGGAGCLATPSKADRWYSFTPATSGNYRIETCGANFDTVLSLFSDCFGNELACNNDYTTGPVTGCTSTRSRIASYALTGSQTYYIRVAAPLSAFISSTSTINLTIIPAPAPAPNDSCSTPTTAVVGANPFDLTEATNDGFSSCATALSRDVWFSFTPTATGIATFSTCGTTLNTVMSIQDFCFGAEAACNDNSGLTGCTNQAVISNFPVTAHIPLLIRVGSTPATAVGSGNLTISLIGCDSIDFNNDGLFPDTADIDDFLSVFGGGTCSNSPHCADIDFNNDGLFPDTADIDGFLSAFSGGGCP